MNFSWTNIFRLLPAWILTSDRTGKLLLGGKSCSESHIYAIALRSNSGSFPSHRTLQHGKYKRWAQGHNKHISGLKLGINNALTPHFQPFFEKSVKDWQNGRSHGARDAVRLAVHSVDSSLASQARERCLLGAEGEITICNADYGPTGWVGMEISTSRKDTIVKSRIMLNEYFLKYRDANYKQYAMCHELGHAVGLGHIDENFSNLNTGSCMDYTRDYINNRSPIVQDFNELVRIYGPADLNCGCPERCTSSVLDRKIGKKTCLSIMEQKVEQGLKKRDACSVIASRYRKCRDCDPARCGKAEETGATPPMPRPTKAPVARPSASPTQAPSENTLDCGCPKTCTSDILDRPMGSKTCRSMITRKMEVNGMSEYYACTEIGRDNRYCRPCFPENCLRRQLGAQKRSPPRKKAGADNFVNVTNVTTTVPRDMVYYVGLESNQKVEEHKRRTRRKAQERKRNHQPRVNASMLKNVEKIGVNTTEWGDLKIFGTNGAIYQSKLDDGTVVETQVSFLLADYGVEFS